MRRAALVAAAALVAITAPRTVHACAGCRNPSMPISRLTAVHLRPGELRASALLAGTTLNVVHEAGCPDVGNCQEVPAQPRYLHDQNIYPGELRTILEIGLTRSWGMEAQLPFRITRTTIRYTDPGGAPYVPLDPDVHHRHETLAGFGDPWLLARFASRWGETLMTARAGVSLPLGRTEENPFALGEFGMRHQHIQFGNGTFDPVVALDAFRTVGKAQLAAYGQAQVSLYENGHGFRAGSRYLAGVQAGTPIWRTLVAALGSDVLHEGAERWDGKIQQDGNLGRTEVLAGLSLTQPFGSTSASLWIRVPVYRRIVTGDEPPGKLSSPLMLSLMLSRTF